MGRPAKYPIQEFNGRRFYRRPGPSGYYRSDPKFGGKYMHRVVWEFHNGPIPFGHHIHHLDGDPANNAIENLVAMDAETHAIHHWQNDGPKPQCCAGFLATVRLKAAEAKRRPEYRRRASEAAKRDAASREPEQHNCVWCDKPYWVKRGYRKKGYCSMSCQGMARNARGVDDVDRTCRQCGVSFRANKYTSVDHCSKSCSGRTAAAKRLAARV
jgi:hypothetical protein